MDPIAIVERSLALIADHHSDPAAIRELLDDGMRFLERPNPFALPAATATSPASWRRWRRAGSS